MKVVNEHIQFPEIEYESPNTSGYVLLLAEIERPFPIKPNSKKKKALISKAKELCLELNKLNKVVSAHVLDGFIIPPGNKPGRDNLKKKNPDIHIPAFDLVIQIETVNITMTRTLRNNKIFLQLEELIIDASKHHQCVVAENVRKIGEVDKNRPGIFLYNFFYADDRRDVLPVWEYTGRWFVNKTGLDNSTLLLPNADEPCDYVVINHCRWDGPLKIIPHLIFRPSLRRYVLANFNANNIIAIPILYKLA